MRRKGCWYYLTGTDGVVVADLRGTLRECLLRECTTSADTKVLAPAGGASAGSAAGMSLVWYFNHWRLRSPEEGSCRWGWGWEGVIEDSWRRSFGSLRWKGLGREGFTEAAQCLQGCHLLFRGTQPRGDQCTPQLVYSLTCPLPSTCSGSGWAHMAE